MENDMSIESAIEAMEIYLEKREDGQSASADLYKEIATLRLQIAQVAAALRQAAALERIADLMDDGDGRESLAESVRIWGSS